MKNNTNKKHVICVGTKKRFLKLNSRYNLVFFKYPYKIVYFLKKEKLCINNKETYLKKGFYIYLCVGWKGKKF